MVSSIPKGQKGHTAYHGRSQPIHHFWDRAGPGKCANGDLVQIVPGAINCVIDFLIIMLVSHSARSKSASAVITEITADTSALAAADYRFTKRGVDGDFRLRRIVSNRPRLRKKSHTY